MCIIIMTLDNTSRSVPNRRAGRDSRPSPNGVVDASHIAEARDYQIFDPHEGSATRIMEPPAATMG